MAMKIREILGRLKLPGATADSTAADTPSTPEMDAEAAATALVELDQARAEVRQKIGETRDRRRAALISDAPDADISKIDREIERLELEAERHDAVEPLLIEAVATARADAHKARLDNFVDAYGKLIDAFADAQTTAGRIRTMMIAVREQARQHGFEQRLPHFSLPQQSDYLSWWDSADIAGFRASAQADLRAVRVQTPRQEAFPVIVKAHVATAGVNPGETIGLPAEQAHRWVKLGLASWAPGTPIPPVAEAAEATQ